MLPKLLDINNDIHVRAVSGVTRYNPVFLLGRIPRGRVAVAVIRETSTARRRSRRRSDVLLLRRARLAVPDVHRGVCNGFDFRAACVHISIKDVAATDTLEREGV